MAKKPARRKQEPEGPSAGARVGWFILAAAVVLLLFGAVAGIVHRQMDPRRPLDQEMYPMFRCPPELRNYPAPVEVTCARQPGARLMKGCKWQATWEVGDPPVQVVGWMFTYPQMARAKLEGKPLPGGPGDEAREVPGGVLFCRGRFLGRVTGEDLDRERALAIARDLDMAVARTWGPNP